MNSPYGKFAGKLLGGGGGGDKKEGGQQTSTMGKVTGAIGQASRQQVSADKQRQVQALIASGMDPAMAQAIAGGQ